MLITILTPDLRKRFICRSHKIETVFIMLFGLWFLVYGFGSYYVTVVILFDYTPPLHEWRGVRGEEIVSSAPLCVFFAVFACLSRTQSSQSSAEYAKFSRCLFAA